MYNPYLPSSWEESPPPPPPPGPPPPPPPSPPREGPEGLLGKLPGELASLLGKLPGGLTDRLRELDTGDILLILIILYLYREDREDNLELIITLGLLLIL